MTDSMHALSIQSPTTLLHLSGVEADVGEGGSGYTLAVLADGYEPGSTEAIRSVVRSSFGVGSSVRTTGHDNAETSFDVVVEGPTDQAVSEGIAALRAVMPSGRGDTVDLIWRPADGVSPASIRTVLAGDLRVQWDDLKHLRCQATVTVTLTCAPHVRSEARIDVEALPVGTAPDVTITTCDTTTGWTFVAWDAFEVKSFTASGGEVVATLRGKESATWPNGNATLTYSPGAIDLSTTPYVAVEYRWTRFMAGLGHGSIAEQWLLETPKGKVAPVSAVGLPGGYVRVTYRPGLASLPYFRLWCTSQAPPVGDDTQTLQVRDIKRSASPSPASKQGARAFTVEGSEPTTGSLYMESRDGTSALGEALLMVGPGGTGYSPDLRQHRTGGGTIETGATDTISGLRENISTARWYAQPPYSAVPEGTYNLLARMRSTVTTEVRIDWKVGSRPLWHPVEATRSGTTGVWLTAWEWTIVSLAVETLPTTRADMGAVQVELQASPDQALTLELDEAWLARVDDDCGVWMLRTNESRIRIDAADAVGLSPRIATSPNGWQWRHPGTWLSAQSNLTLDPRKGCIVHYVSTSIDPKVSASYHPRWTGQAAK